MAEVGTTAAKAVRIHKNGGYDVLQLDDVSLPAPSAQQVLIELYAIGVNFIDTYHRSGLYKLTFPATLGREGAGVVKAVGSEVKGLDVGQRVVFFSGGAYATHALVDAQAVVKVADGISFKDAAAIHLQGLTAHSFITSVYPVKQGDTVLIHAAAGGTGNVMVQMCKLKGATVIGTVGSAEKAELAKAAGCDHVINYNESDFREEVMKITNGVGVHAVFDGVGKSTFDGSLKSLRRRGSLVTFGNASGPVPPVDPLTLTSHGSIFLSRPTVAHFVADRAELEWRSEEIHRWMGEGKLKQRIAKEFKLEEAAQAHEAIESRKYAGKILLIVKE